MKKLLNDRISGLQVFDQRQRISNPGFSSNGSIGFIRDRWRGQGNGWAFYETKHMGQRQKICSHPGIACPGGLGQGNQKKKGLNYLFWKVPSTNTSSLWPIPNSLQKKWSFHTKRVATLRITSRKPSMIWPLGIFCWNRFEPMRQCFKWWCFPTICFYCSNLILYAFQNTGCKSRRSAWSTYFWLGRSSEWQEVSCWNSQKIILIQRSMQKAFPEKTPIFLSQTVISI